MSRKHELPCKHATETQTVCRVCEMRRIRGRRGYAKNKEQRKSATQAYRDENRLRALARTSAWRARNPKQHLKYLGIKDAHRFDELLARQGGMCAICRTTDWGKPTRGGKAARPSADHDHKTGLMRGVLCRKCNSGLGQFADSPTLLAAAFEYLILS